MMRRPGTHAASLAKDPSCIVINASPPRRLRVEPQLRALSSFRRRTRACLDTSPYGAFRCTLRPERSRLVDEGARLCADVAEARGKAKDDRVVMASSSAFASAAAWSASPPAPRNTSGGTVSGTRFTSTPASGTLRALRATACCHGLDVAVGGCGFQVFGNSLGKAAKALAATRGHHDRIGNSATKKCG